MCNINFTRPFLEQVIRLGIPVATDVHDIADLNDAYNRDYMASADILFMSHEKLPIRPMEWIRQIREVFAPSFAVVGMGDEGALLGLPNGLVEHIKAVQTRPIVNTIGAGDSLFSAFLHSYMQSGNPVAALKRAVVFASWKIGVSGAVDGFITEAELDDLMTQVSH